MHHTLGMRIEDIATYLRASKSTVQRLLTTYPIGTPIGQDNCSTPQPRLGMLTASPVQTDD
jgi:hypothetical protein